MHVVWDWNGTLLDDTGACVDTLNIMLTKRGLKPVTMDFFRENFAFPARAFYNRVGMEVPDSEWKALALEYHVIYSQQPTKLNVDAIDALERIKASGVKQSILSALRQDKLDAEMKRHSLDGYFEYVRGTDNLDGGSKLDSARELFKLLNDEELVMIGDSLHDFEVATAMGVKCVLVSTGSHSYERLEPVAPAYRTIRDAVDAILDR